MAKSQKKSNREVRKPKAEKSPEDQRLAAQPQARRDQGAGAHDPQLSGGCAMR